MNNSIPDVLWGCRDWEMHSLRKQVQIVVLVIFMRNVACEDNFGVARVEDMGDEWVEELRTGPPKNNSL